MHKLYPDRINNKTNGVTFRRWLLPGHNPPLTAHAGGCAGARMCSGRSRAQPDSSWSRSPGGRTSASSFAEQRLQSKCTLAALIYERLGVVVNPEALFDVQVKRIHEYKRQLLNLLHTVALYQAIRAEPGNRVGAAGEDLCRQSRRPVMSRPSSSSSWPTTSRAPSTTTPPCAACSRWCSCPTTTSAWRRSIIPAADLSEQISTAGYEASGTSNMKFGLNGALTIGTLDGANVEMCERVGDRKHVYLRPQFAAG
jgi:glycogen phosphorylase